MESRMNKYRDEHSEMSRVEKHESLYKDINNSQIEDYAVKSNATVLGNNENEIDIEKIKKILDNKYKEAPKRRSIRLEEKEEDSKTTEEEEPTKEYDLNNFLAKAKDDKEETYEEVRSKKLRDTQFDILNNLNLQVDKKEEEEHEDKDLMNLINTITINEVKKNEEKEPSKESDPLDILTDLKGDEHTEVFEGIKEEIEKIEKTSKILNASVDDNKVDNTFYTKSNKFAKKDLVDDDFLDDDKMNLGVKILIALIIIAFVIGLVIFIKSFL